MITLEKIKQISITSPSKIVMLVMDGLGGLADPGTGRTELETASTPHLDQLAERGICGLIDPVSTGVTPGSGPGHMALFGYDPYEFTVGRGVLEALGVDFDIREEDIVARGNFCTVDDQSRITDRRAGRITTDTCAELCNLLSQIKLEGVDLFVQPVREHRFLFVLRGAGLAAELNDTDPQRTGVVPYTVAATETQAQHAATIVNDFINKARDILGGQRQGNMILLRGFSQLPQLPSMNEIYKLNPLAVARYPMYRGLAKLVGMKAFEASNGIEEEVKIVADCYSEHDFFYVHVKETDSAGEDGDFNRKVRVIEEVDAALPRLLDLKPEVIVVASDHSTPALLKGHSWHPVPFLLCSQWCRADNVKEFSESACALGGLGRFPSLDIMPLAMANALKLIKFGA